MVFLSTPHPAKCLVDIPVALWYNSPRMKQFFLFSVLSLGALSLSSCDKVESFIAWVLAPKYDAQKPEESLKAMAAELDDTGKTKLAAAVLTITLSKGADGAKEAMDGKTVEEILELAKQAVKGAIDRL